MFHALGHINFLTLQKGLIYIMMYYQNYAVREWVFMKFGNNLFSSTQVYVAFLKVMILDGLHIINLNQYIIQTQNSAI